MDSKRISVTIGIVIGLLGYLTSGVLYFGAGLVMPQGLVPFMWVVWLIGAWFTVRLARRRSLWVLASGPVAVLFWMGFVSFGAWAFGWVA
jgi:hypothetical protein